MVVQDMEYEDRHEDMKGAEVEEAKSENSPLYDTNFAAYLTYVYQQSLTENLLINSQVKNAQNIINKQVFLNGFDTLQKKKDQNQLNKEVQNTYSNSPQYPQSNTPSPVPEDLRIDKKKKQDLNNQTIPPSFQDKTTPYKTTNSAITNPVNLSNHLFTFNNHPSKHLDHTLYSTQEIAKMIASELRRYGIPQAVFSEKVLGRSQGTLSDLLRNPKPWNKLKAGKETFRRMLEWLNQCEDERLQVLKESPSHKIDKAKRNFFSNGLASSNSSPLSYLSASPPLQLTTTTTFPNPNNLSNNIINYSPIPQSSSKCISSSSKKPRLVFTEIQRRTLNAIFKEVRRPNRDVQITIAQQLNLKLSTVSNFFMNARRRSLDKFSPSDNKLHSPNSTNNKLNDYHMYYNNNTDNRNKHGGGDMDGSSIKIDHTSGDLNSSLSDSNDNKNIIFNLSTPTGDRHSSGGALHLLTRSPLLSSIIKQEI